MQPYFQDEWSTVYLGDCKEILPSIPQVDLVLIDPPYGIGESNERALSRGKLAKARDYGSFDWDKIPIDNDLLFACLNKGKWQACFGGNYYLMPPSSCWLVWDKYNTGDFADCELVWTNYPGAVRIKRHLWNGMLRKGQEPRFHPTQKPLGVVLWVMGLAPSYETVLDCFAGSGTTLVAAKELGKKAIGIEKEEKNCKIMVERLRETTPSLFVKLPVKPEQLGLFSQERKEAGVEGWSHGKHS